MFGFKEIPVPAQLAQLGLRRVLSLSFVAGSCKSGVVTVAPPSFLEVG
jgi:hypothetical protein